MNSGELHLTLTNLCKEAQMNAIEKEWQFSQCTSILTRPFVKWHARLRLRLSINNLAPCRSLETVSRVCQRSRDNDRAITVLLSRATRNRVLKISRFPGYSQSHNYDGRERAVARSDPCWAFKFNFVLCTRGVFTGRSSSPSFLSSS